MKQVIILLITVSFGAVATAQQGLSKISIQHSTHVPIGSVRGFVDNISPRGFSADYSYFINNNFSLGFASGYSDLYQKKDRQTYSFSETYISAVKSHSLQIIPLMLKGSYSNIKEGSVFQPYAGIAAGGSLINYEEWFGTLVDEKSGFRFTIAPEIGTRISFNKYSLGGVDLSLRYDYTAFRYNDVKNLQTISLNLGLFFFNRN
ncbi:outer membrane beta-barrel protein [Lacibacter sediminis]|uniref:Outer membrane beta-barrel protein n=1 Tax=Lacibacter sediminis TaxID=2760713 RepID=A0A7G5XJ31_9BACT|nr:outer membrane beta-barrel protein [Lacibacter sediminis]QNA45484.1 outer membrane beta-barrel protein [Lacibacter sediminis]